MGDHKAVSTAVAKVMAYQRCGEHAKAKQWLRTLILELGYNPEMIGE